MFAISLLIVVIIITALIGKNKSPYSRIIIGSVFGVCFFAVWRFLLYYADLANWSELHQQAVFFMLCATAATLSMLLIRIKHELTIAIFTTLIFIVSLIINFGLEVPIKNVIAFQTDLFKLENEQRANNNTFNINTYTHSVGGYRISVPNGWQIKSNKGDNFIYFLLAKNNTPIGEFRPKCFETSKIAMTDAIKNLRTNIPATHRTEIECHRYPNAIYSCKVEQYNIENKPIRINWLEIRNDTAKGVELDFVLQQSNQDIMQDIDSIIESIRPASSTSKNTECLSLAEWF